MTPATHPGLLGICLSGAGPTILALVGKSPSTSSVGVNGIISTDVSDITLDGASQGVQGGATVQMREIGEGIKQLWKSEGIEVEWMALEVDDEGATLVEL